MNEILSGFVPFIIVFAVIVIAGLVWWGRKSSKYPEYAAAKEKELDAMLESLKKYAPDSVDAVLQSIQDKSLVGSGQAVQARIDRLESSVKELTDAVKAKL